MKSGVAHSCADVTDSDRSVAGPAISDGQMDRDQVRKPRIFRGKPVRWPDMAFGHLTINPYSIGGRTPPTRVSSLGTGTRHRLRARPRHLGRLDRPRARHSGDWDQG